MKGQGTNISSVITSRGSGSSHIPPGSARVGRRRRRGEKPRLSGKGNANILLRTALRFRSSHPPQKWRVLAAPSSRSVRSRADIHDFRVTATPGWWSTTTRGHHPSCTDPARRGWRDTATGTGGAAASRSGRCRTHKHVGHTAAGMMTRMMAMWTGVAGMMAGRRPTPNHTGRHGHLVAQRRRLVHGPHVHGDGPVRLNHSLPDGRKNDFTVRPHQVVVAFLDVRANNIDVQEGLLDKILHSL